jgi:hypothetical protein
MEKNMMFTACLPQHSQNPTRSKLIHKMKVSHLFWLSRSKGMTVDIWIRDYNPPRCFQKKISGRGKHNEHITELNQVVQMAPYVFIKIVCYLYISSFAVQMYGNT